MKRGIRVVALTAVVALALTGCVSWFRPPPSTSTSKPSQETVAAALRPYYEQKLVWSSCGTQLDCATAKAPLDWANPGGDRIDLALIRHRATRDRLGSLLVNPGGPGGSGYDFLKSGVETAVDATLAARYDIVGFDPRGVNHSTPVRCSSQSRQLDDFLFDITPGTPGSDSWIADSETHYADFGARCKKLTGPLLGHVDTESAARDLDMLRAALGDRKLNYLGYSYGTFLGATYASLFPKKTGRLVLDGALDPTTSNSELIAVQAEGFENAFRAYLADCLTRSSCPFRGLTVEQSLTRTQSLFAALQRQPIRNSDGRELGASTFFTAIVFPLYSQRTWSYEDQLFTDVERGSARVAFALADAYYERKANGTYADNSSEAFIAINCLDHPSTEDVATLRAEAAALAKVAPTFGPQMSYDVSCDDWPYPATRTPGPISAAGSAPIVVVGTTGDPATPYRWAQGLASQLQNGHLVTFKGEGHTAYNKGNDCVDTAVDSFFTDGTVPKDGLTC